MFSVLRRLCGESLFIGLPSVRSKVSQASLAPDFRTQLFCSTGALIQQTTKSSYSLSLRCVGSCSWSSLNDHMKIFRCDESSGFICSYFGWLPLLPKKCIKKQISLKLTYARIWWFIFINVKTSSCQRVFIILLRSTQLYIQVCASGLVLKRLFFISLSLISR